MTPAFSSWQAFFAMGGYAFFVWLSVIVTLIALSALVLHTVLERRRLLTAIQQQQARDRRIRAAKQKNHATSAGDQP